MSDPGFLNPLLAAYDARLAAAEEEAGERAALVGAVEGQVGTGPMAVEWPLAQRAPRLPGRAVDVPKACALP
jgi:hypothetical protein